jgi:hypothetical protein
LLAVALDLGLMRPLLSSTSLAPGETLRAYYEPESSGGAAVMLDRQQAGYMTDVEVDGSDLLIPAGRTIAIPLRQGAEIALRSLAPDLAPYVVLGVETRPQESTEATRLTGAVVLEAHGGALETRPWDASRPWASDESWLRDLRARCNFPSQGVVSIRAEAEELAVQLGSCAARVSLPGEPSARLLVVVAGPAPAVASAPEPGWQQTREIVWRLVALVFLRVALLAFALGSVATALAAGSLFLLGELSRTAAILTWGASYPIVVAAAAGCLLAYLSPRRTRLAWTAGLIVLALQVTAVVAAVAFLDVGTFGHERIEQSGDSGCSVVGYSTVRGDSLRHDSDGLIERLGKACAGCRDRTSRFSREAQTLRWVRETVCSPSFPAPPGGQVVFLGGGNDDLFYRPAGLRQLLVDFAGTLRYAAQPIGGARWQEMLEFANRRALATLDEQAADVEAIARCATTNGRRFFFVHDFLLWDMTAGRTPARRQTFDRRRRAVQAAGGHFIDLLEEFRATAGVAWLNDFIHPSAFAQQQIADLLCTRLAEEERGAA